MAVRVAVHHNTPAADWAVFAAVEVTAEPAAAAVEATSETAFCPEDINVDAVSVAACTPSAAKEVDADSGYNVNMPDISHHMRCWS